MKNVAETGLADGYRAIPNIGRFSISVKRSFACLCALGVLAISGNSIAADVPLPPVNLGETSFEDGIAYPGLLVEETFIYYHAGSFTDSNGDNIPGSNRVTTKTATTHIGWTSNYRVLGGLYGAEVLLPIADLDVHTDFGPDGSARGAGDLVLGPIFIEWNDSKLLGRPFFHRFNFDFSVPTGKYSKNSSVNVGSNIYTVNPYYAFTLLPTDRWEISSRLYYLWCSENHAPFVGLGAKDAQPGQAVHANFAASYELIEDLRIGVSGYVLQQITDDKIDGDDQARSMERVFGIGPGLKYTYKQLSMYLNTYYETAAENRPEGIKGLIKLSMVF